MLREAVKVGLRFLGLKQATETCPPYLEAAVSEGLTVVLRIAQATQVRVLDTGLRQGISEAGLAEALLATDRREPYVRHDTDVAVDERGDERVDVPPFVSGGPQTGRDGRDVGRPEQIIERDRKSLGHRANGQETWLDRSLALQAAQRPDGDACLLRQPFPRPPTVFP